MASGNGPPPPLGSQGMVPQPVVQQPAVQQPAAQQPAAQQPPIPQPQPQVPMRPMSPWAWRYGVAGVANDSIYKTFPVQHSRHTSYRNPTLHPKYYGDIPEAEDYGVFSSGYEKDKFLCSEFWFLEHMKGQPSWQLGPINRSLQFSTRGFVPGGHIYSLDGEAHIHNLIYETERIQVDESTWFPFFKKSRWYGSAEADWAFGGGPWTVDNPRVWQELSISIELANRMLNALIRDKHTILQTMLFGKLGYWTQAAFHIHQRREPHPKAKVLLSYPFFRKHWDIYFPDIPCIMDKVTTFTEAEWRDRLIALGERQTWGLIYLSFAESQNISGATFVSHGNVIGVNITRVRALIEGDITLAERCKIHFLVANTILHELMHAFLFVRERTDTDITLTALDRNNPTWDEPFVDFGASAELGYAFEKGLYGGVIRDCPPYNATDFIPIGLHLATWPFPTLSQGMSALGAKAEGHPEFAQGAENRLIAIPAIWFSRILSEEFWQDKMIRKSDNNFHLIDHFSSRVHHKPNIPIWEYRAAPVIERQRELEEQQLRNELNEGMVDMITHWVHNENLWKEARAGWYDDLKATWSKSVWGSQSERFAYNNFNDAYSQRDLVRSGFFSHRLLTAVTFKDSTYQGYTGYLKSNPVRGIWHAVGLLMCAAIPIRTFDMTKNTPTLELAIDIHSSDAAPTKVTKQIKRPLEWGTKDSAPASVFFDPLMRPGQTFAYGSFTQFDYLDLVEKLIRFWAQDGQPIPTPWLLEIQRVESGLRTKLLTNFNSPHLSALNWWADEAWDLAIPEFGTAMSRWNQTTQQWESV